MINRNWIHSKTNGINKWNFENMLFVYAIITTKQDSYVTSLTIQQYIHTINMLTPCFINKTKRKPQILQWIFFNSYLSSRRLLSLIWIFLNSYHLKCIWTTSKTFRNLSSSPIFFRKLEPFYQIFYILYNISISVF